MKNKYYRRSRIAEKSFEMVIQNFAYDSTATKTALLTKVSVRSINTIYLNLRKRIAQELDNEWQLVKKHHKKEVKTSRRPVQRPCKLEGQKILVLVFSQHEHQVHLDVVSDARKNKPALSSRKKAVPINAQNEVAEQLWVYLDKRLANFRGLSEDTFELHIKETAFRFNHQDDLNQKLLFMLEREPL